MNGSIHKALYALTAVVLVVLGAGLGALEPSAVGQPPNKPVPAGAEKAQPKDAPAKAAPKEVTITGRVLDPDVKPLAGAKLFVTRSEGGVREVGTSGADGKFAVKVPANIDVYLIARAEGVGINFAFVSADRPNEAVELRTVKDQAIRGRVVDTQGKPVAGATVVVSKLAVYDNGSLDGFLAEYARGRPVERVKGLERATGVLPASTTDADGRFTINGAGAERLVTVRVSGAGLADTEARVVNRKDFDPKPYNEPKPDPQPGQEFAPVLQGPELSLIAEPEKRVRGRVTDVDSGKPRAGVRVTLMDNSPRLSAVTDAEGRYEIRGARKTATYLVGVEADPDTRHVATRVQVDDTAGYEPVTADVKVKKGVVITGKVIDTGTKKPVRGYATIAIMADNKFVKKYPPFGVMAGDFFPTGEDGVFRAVTVPGPVLLIGVASNTRGAQDRYKPAVADVKYPQYFNDRKGAVPIYHSHDGTGWGAVLGNYCKVLEINADAETVTQDILLDPVE